MNIPKEWQTFCDFTDADGGKVRIDEDSADPLDRVFLTITTYEVRQAHARLDLRHVHMLRGALARWLEFYELTAHTTDPERDKEGDAPVTELLE